MSLSHTILLVFTNRVPVRRTTLKMPDSYHSAIWHFLFEISAISQEYFQASKK